MAVRIQIARSSAEGDSYEVRIIGPGGWRTSLSQAPLSACMSDALAWGRVLNAPIEELNQ